MKPKLFTRTLQVAALFSLPILFPFLGSVASAADCALNGAVENLHLSNPARSELRNPVDVRFELDGDNLKAEFEVRNNAIHAKKQFVKGDYPFQYDVVELFVSVAPPTAGSLPYFEFEISPYGQIFDVQINDPHHSINNIDLGVEHAAQLVPGGWRAQFIVPLRKLGWDGDPTKIVGNAYSIFGASPNRSYWSRSLPQQDKPNFHQPQFFKPLLDCR